MYFAELRESYQRVRRQSIALVEGLSSEDLATQSMTDASPGKWHLAHTSWFFEQFVLIPSNSNYRSFDPEFNYLFNSYYEQAGQRHARHQRGLLTRPGLEKVLAYRSYVDEHMLSFLQSDDNYSARNRYIVTTGLHHEMQHQELLLTDLLHMFSFNPLNCEVFAAKQPIHRGTTDAAMDRWIPFEGGLVDIGFDDSAGEADSEAFCFDCETPRHRVYLEPFKLCSQLVTNGEWLAFMEDGGYAQATLWLSDGWQCCQRENWAVPLYWRSIDGDWHQYGLDGLRAIDPNAPVCHVSYYEADAFARWSGKRLPREAEWELAAAREKVEGNFLEQAQWRPQPARQTDTNTERIQQLYGDVWEWTQSPYSAYPGFKPKPGALGEYNGKFMANQFVLRGGSCATPRAQLRPSYRNFFYPHQRWQFMGLRLAEDS